MCPSRLQRIPATPAAEIEPMSPKGLGDAVPRSECVHTWPMRALVGRAFVVLFVLAASSCAGAEKNGTSPTVDRTEAAATATVSPTPTVVLETTPTAMVFIEAPPSEQSAVPSTSPSGSAGGELAAVCESQGVTQSGCLCFAAAVGEVAPSRLVGDVVGAGDDLGQLGAFGFSLLLIAQGCESISKVVGAVEPDSEVIADLTTSCAASGFFDSRTCACIAAGALRELSQPDRGSLRAMWKLDFDPIPIELLAIGCNHLSFEMTRAHTLGVPGVAPLRPGPSDPAVMILLEAMRALPAVAVLTDDQIFEQMVSTCYFLDTTDTAESLVAYGLTFDDFEAFRGYIVTINSSGAVCTEYRDAIAAALDDLGL